MLGISVVTPQCLTVGKAGLATNHTSLTAPFAFFCLHPAELQQLQQRRCRRGAEETDFKWLRIRNAAESANWDHLRPITEETRQYLT